MSVVFLSQYIFLFQVPWLPESLIGLHDYRMFSAMLRGSKALFIRLLSLSHAHMYSLSLSLLHTHTHTHSLYLSLSAPIPPLSHQGVKNKDQFPPEVLEAYKYIFSKPGALTAPLNYYRFHLATISLSLSHTLSLSLSLFLSLSLSLRHIPNCSHWVQQDVPELCNQLISEFFND